MFSRAPLCCSVVLMFGLGCSAGGDPRPDPGDDQGGSGGSDTSTGGGGGSGAGGTGGRPDAATGGTGGRADAGSAGSGGSGGGGGSGGSAGGGGGMDAGSPMETGPAPMGDGGANPPAAAGQGPTADGKIVFSQDFEMGMTGVTRSPNGLPEDRVQIVDDPKAQRGKVIRIEYRQGDNFRTSGGTEPRSWISAADGYTIKSSTKISVAWGAMFENVNGATYSFAQIIRSGGPLWMFHINSGGSFRISVNRGSGGGSNLLTFQPMTWYDFRVDVDYRGGGSIEFYANGRMVARGTGDGGPSDGRWDGGVYWQSGAKSTRVVYVSNVSIGER
jgi:hypothetical protein